MLPIDPLLPRVVAALTTRSRVILRAPPGAGKTTRVPAALLDAGIADGQQVVVLEPRRIAARSAAEFVAATRNGALGEEVGYRVRLEQRGGPDTRLWYVTEGVLGRQLAHDPFLERVGAVVLDEFHERHLPGDVALAVVRELQETVRPDLKLVVMSATLDTDALAAYLGPGAAVLTSEGRAYPVRVAHSAPAAEERLPARVASALAALLAADDDDGGDVLVFLPGAGEIRQTTEAIAPLAGARGLDVLPLHGDLPLDAQRRVLQRGPRRRIVLATNVAETSLTVDGVTAVIDSGLARIAEYDARRGINAVRLAPISRAAAEQRAGRAGRTAAGRCLRLWSAAEHAARLARETPEVRRLELSGTLLELRAWGGRDTAGFGWLDPPRPQALTQAEQLLTELGALDSSGAVTGVGRDLLRIPAPPRIARLLLETRRRGVGGRGALVTALAVERDILREARAFGATGDAPWPAGPSDPLLRAELFAAAEAAGFTDAKCLSLGLERSAVQAVARTRRRFLDQARERASRGGASRADGGDEELLKSILAAFPDRVCRRRAPGSLRALMVGGSGVALDPRSVVREAELFVAIDLERGSGADARVRAASAIERAWLRELFPEALRAVDELEFDAAQERVVRRARELYRDLVLAERVSADVEAQPAGAILAAAARADPERAVALSDADRTLLARIRFLRRSMPELALPAPEEALGAALDALCAGRRSFAELRRADLGAALYRGLREAQRQGLEREAPERLMLPDGGSVPIAYPDDRPPFAAARIQRLFGWMATPRLAMGRVALVLELLAPNQRAVQVTDDLASFWRRTYPEVRKQLRGRYPKHAWPEDPMSAPPPARRRL